MIVRISWARIRPGAWPSVEQKYRELNEIPIAGFLGRLVTQDVNDPENLYTLTLWEDLASVRAWEASPDFESLFVAAILPYVVGSFSVSFSEVKVSELAGLKAFIERRRET